ncbi:MAG: acyltransferase domain-containing protein, partial [Acidimicrobiales bacterium]
LGIAPTACAGHSLGEYTALVAAGALGIEDSFSVVAERGEAMQAAADAQPGTMLVISGCDADTADIACRLADGDVWVANFNSADETVIAGERHAVNRAGVQARRLGAKRVKSVPVGGAFHTPLMRPARERLRKALATVAFHPPEVPVVANVDAQPHVSADDWALLLCAQLSSPVRWRQSIRSLGGVVERSTESEGLFVELGPGASLASMVLRTLPSVNAITVAAPDDLDRLVDAVAGDTALHAFAAGHQGEHLYVSERLVISPAAGVWEPAPGVALTGDDPVSVGTLLGTVAGAEVRSPFDGHLMGVLAHPDERVQTGQPIAWLRVS